MSEAARPEVGASNANQPNATNQVELGNQVDQPVQVNAVIPGNPPNSVNPGNQGDTIPTKPKSKKKKKNKWGVAAPRQPLTGYVRYLNSRRDQLRNDNPSLTFADITKILAQEWANLSAEDKQPYKEAGDQDRERYLQEMETYKKTDAYKDYLRQQEEKQKSKEKPKEKDKEKEPEEKKMRIGAENGLRLGSGFDIPIFTEDFLELNRAREAELRQLRRSSTDYEVQNASLSRIVESMRGAVDELEVDIKSQRASNVALTRHLDQLRASLAAAFHAVALPDSNDRPTVDTIDSYMLKLHGIFTGAESSQHHPLLARVSGIVDRLDLHG